MTDSVLAGALFILVGLVFGSFGTVLICRLPANCSILGRSQCASCKRQLRPLELVPVISYFVLRGRCKGCGIVIGMMYPVVELMSAGLFFLAYFFYPPLVAWIVALASWVLLIIAVIDAQQQVIPDILTISLLLLGLALRMVTDDLDFTGVALGGGFLGLLWLVSLGKWIGSGDVFLAVAIGFLLGNWLPAAISLLLSYVFGALVALTLLALHRTTLRSHIPFGPFLALSAIWTLFFGELVFYIL